MRDADRLAVITDLRYDNTGPQLCAYQLTASGPQRTAEPCQRLPGLVSGFEPSVVWLLKTVLIKDPASLQRWRWSQSGLVEQGSLILKSPLSLASQSSMGSTLVPLITSGFTEEPYEPHDLGAVRWSDRWGSLVFEHMDAELRDVDLNIRASPSLFWGKLPSTEGSPMMRIRAR